MSSLRSSVLKIRQYWFVGLLIHFRSGKYKSLLYSFIIFRIHIFSSFLRIILNEENIDQSEGKKLFSKNQCVLSRPSTLKIVKSNESL